MENFVDKVAFISGGVSGIGLGIAKALLDAGAKVAIGYVTEAHFEEALEVLDCGRDRLRGIRADVTDIDAMTKAASDVVAAFGKVHILVNNAGISSGSKLEDTAPDEWARVMRVNVDGVYNGIHSFLPHIRSHGEGGHISATSSLAGLFGHHDSAYSASKFAVVGLMEALRLELADTNIGVSVICPGGVATRAVASFVAARPNAYAIMKVLMDPFACGQLVVAGISRNDLFIVTHPEFGPYLEARQHP